MSRGPTAYSMGPAADDGPRAWAHLVSVKSMSPTPGIKFSRGPGPRVKVFLLRTNVDLKNRILKIRYG
jgi:hypothetical protein